MQQAVACTDKPFTHTNSGLVHHTCTCICICCFTSVPAPAHLHVCNQVVLAHLLLLQLLHRPLRCISGAPGDSNLALHALIVRLHLSQTRRVRNMQTKDVTTSQLLLAFGWDMCLIPQPNSRALLACMQHDHQLPLQLLLPVLQANL
jgi:hypothetical protein